MRAIGLRMQCWRVLRARLELDGSSVLAHGPVERMVRCAALGVGGMASK